MGRRKIILKESVAESIAALSWFIESKGLTSTADKFTDAVYDFFEKLADSRRIHANCREPGRALLGYKCITHKKKYTVVILESDTEIIICEFILSKNIYW